MVVPSGSELLLIKEKHDGGFTRTCLSSFSITPLSQPYLSEKQGELGTFLYLPQRYKQTCPYCEAS